VFLAYLSKNDVEGNRSLTANNKYKKTKFMKKINKAVAPWIWIDLKK
jgi:hypothetical protein